VDGGYGAVVAGSFEEDRVGGDSVEDAELEEFGPFVCDGCVEEESVVSADVFFGAGCGEGE